MQPIQPNLSTPLLQNPPVESSPAESPPTGPTQQTSQTILVRDTWENRMVYQVMPQMREVNSNLGQARCLDGARQTVGAIFFGIFCVPCAVTRLLGHCTGWWNPLKVECLGTSCSVPGLEYCSSAACELSNRGYEGDDYTAGQNQGSGFSRRTLDGMAIVGSGVFVAAAIGCGCGCCGGAGSI